MGIPRREFRLWILSPFWVWLGTQQPVWGAGHQTYTLCHTSQGWAAIAGSGFVSLGSVTPAFLTLCARESWGMKPTEQCVGLQQSDRLDLSPARDIMLLCGECWAQGSEALWPRTIKGQSRPAVG